MNPGLTALLALASTLLCCANLQAQWQLPPGTSSSTDTGPAAAASDGSAELARAEALMTTQDWKSAVTILKPLTARSAKNAHAWYDLGFCLEALGDEAGAKQAYIQANTIDLAAVPSRVALGLLTARAGDSETAAKLLREALELPGTAENAEAKGRAYRALARIDLTTNPDRSRDELIAAIKLTGETPEDVLLGGEIAEALHDDAAAEQAFARALELQPSSVEAAVEYARILVREGKEAAAQDVLNAAAKEHPTNVQIHAEQTSLLVKQKKFAEALPTLEELHGREPANAALTRLLARTYVAVGTPAKADPLFAQLQADEPSNGEVRAEFADSLIRQKRNPEAEAVLDKALALQFPSKESRGQAAAELAFAASADHHPETVIRAIAIRDENLLIDAPSAFLLATAHDTLHHTGQAAGFYRKFLELADKRYPDEEWQAQQRLQVLSRAK